MQSTLFDEPSLALPERIGAARVQVSDSKTLLRPGSGSLASFDYAVNPYMGCSFGCAYCYAAFFVEGARRETWGEWVNPKVEAVARLRVQDLFRKRVYMSSATDPYQPIEAKLGLTRQVVEIMLRAETRLVVQTRGPLVTRDIDLLQQFQDVRVNMSITTDEDEVRKRYEPSCASVERRLEAVAELAKAGIRTNISVSPMLPMRDPTGFAQRAKEMGVASLWASYFHDDSGDYAAGTRSLARQLAREDGWNYGKYLVAKKAMKAVFKPEQAGGH